jgi:hypothetical protein
MIYNKIGFRKKEENNMGFINWIDGLSKGMKILVFFPIWGWVFGFLYRLFKFINDTSKIINLIGAILFVLGPLGLILEIIDFVLVIVNDKPSFLVD